MKTFDKATQNIEMFSEEEIDSLRQAARELDKKAKGAFQNDPRIIKARKGA